MREGEQRPNENLETAFFTKMNFSIGDRVKLPRNNGTIETRKITGVKDIQDCQHVVLEDEEGRDKKPDIAIPILELMTRLNMNIKIETLGFTIGDAVTVLRSGGGKPYPDDGWVIRGFTINGKGRESAIVIKKIDEQNTGQKTVPIEELRALNTK